MIFSIVMVWMVNRHRRKELEIKTTVAMRALYKGVCDEDTLIACMGGHPLTAGEKVVRRFRRSISFLLAGVGYLVVLILRQKGIILSVDDYGNYGFRFTVASVLLAIGIAGMIAYVMERRRMNAEAAEK